MKNISLSDITLKHAATTMSFREKIEIAKQLDRLRVDCVELARIENKKIDSLLIKSVAMAVKYSAVAVPVAPNAEGVETAWAALKEARHPRLQLCAPMSPAQMEYFWHMKPAKLLETVSAVIGRCKELCADVEFVADDACRSEREFLCKAIKTAIDAGATRVTVCDSAGLMFPEELSDFLVDLKQNVPETERISLGISVSDTLSMAGACAFAAVRAGAEAVKVISGGSGVTRIADFAQIVRARGDTLGYGCDIRYSELGRITSQIERMCTGERGTNSPFGSGLQDEESAFELSEHDDRAAVAKAVERIGYDLSEEDIARVYDEFLRIASGKGTIGSRELDLIVASTALQVPPTYRLSSYVINCGNVISATAHIRLDKAGQTIEGICIGDGPIDAAFLAIEQSIGHHYELDDFRIRSVTEGREAMGESVVRLRSDGKLYSGMGISTDIVGASIQAYMNALNKIVYEEA